MTNEKDWYPSTQEGEYVFYTNLDAKIDGYSAKYPFLTADYRLWIHTFCQAFIEGYEVTEENNATKKQMSKWFDELVRSKDTNALAPPAPVFKEFSLPTGTFLGIEQQCRDFRRLLKAQANYDAADGLDLMLERGEPAARDLENVSPELKITVDASGLLGFEWKKSGFDMLELQWRKAGTPMWQNADKSTEKIIEFTPPATEPGVPEKFEFRAVYLIKNKRVGNWSPIYTETVG